MKKIILLSTCLSLMVCIAFAQTAPKPKPKASPLEDTIQYSLGVYMMQQLLAKTGFVVNDVNLFKKAIDDVMQGKKLMINPVTAESRLLAYQDVYRQRRGRELEEALFAKVKKEPGFITLSSGVAYSVSKAGKGITPTAKDTLVLNVVSTLADGTVVDDVNKSKQSYMTLASEVILGLKEVLLKMQEGAIFRAILPAATAYGSVGVPGSIPPNSALIYDVALVSVRQAK